ncbi:MAG TPA: hypothetical protein DEB40_08835 [Elusimicrobia bacterium]|nr:hypothetical protein [Elusimicrobiota bacterium]HBT61834.1 hypothetical protein [Elusimicrobiota bacterium]
MGEKTGQSRPTQDMRLAILQILGARVDHGEILDYVKQKKRPHRSGASHGGMIFPSLRKQIQECDRHQDARAKREKPAQARPGKKVLSPWDHAADSGRDQTRPKNGDKHDITIVFYRRESQFPRHAGSTPVWAQRSSSCIMTGPIMNAFWAAVRGLDEALFHQVNQVWTNSWFDVVFPFLTDLNRNRILVWGALPAAILWWLYAQRGRALRAIAALTLAVALSDALSHRFIKPWFQRARPEKAGVSVVLRTRAHVGYSFPSNHAANSFSAAAVLGLAYPGLRWAALLMAALVAYSRVYVGVHFPADVLAGAILGLGLGIMTGLTLVRPRRR